MPTLRAGIDWFSGSMPDGEGAWEWAMQGIHAMNTIAAGGDKLEPRSLMGYQGVSVAGCFVGTRHDGYYIQLSSHHANEWFNDIYREEMHVTRLDIQVTAQFDTMPLKMGEECYNASTAYSDGLPVNKRWKVYRFEGSDGGYTTYIGSPRSRERGAIYNKEAQSSTDEYLRSWRYEVRYRDELARKWAELLYRGIMPRESAILAGVDTWLRSRGIHLDFLHGPGAIALPKVRSQRTDVERRLRWLREQVAPSVRWLLETQDRDTILLALGLIEQQAVP